MIPIVMSGGSGTRLWPLSRAQYPKQFCDLFEESLQLKTLKRLQPLGEPWTLTTSSLKVLTQRTLREAQLPEENVIYEPFGCNTAPAIALTCHIFQTRGMNEEIVGIFSADHLVQDTSGFQKSVELAQACAQDGHVVTLGIQPTYPATGYGYIETKSDEYKNSGDHKALWAKRFCEKPDQATAEEFLKAGCFFWNAGMFVFKNSVMVDLLQKNMPELWGQIQKVKPDLSNVSEVYETLEKVSIDYGVMEKLDQLLCIPADIGWSDVGSWEEMAKLPQQENQNEIQEVNATNNYISSRQEKSYGLIGVEDLIVVDTEDALLISKKGESQQVKKIVENLEKKNVIAATENTFNYRPWGKYEILRDTDKFKSKVIQVEPGQRLSYQSHNQRAEHWIVVDGEGEVTLDGEVKKVKAGDYIFIPLKAKHRMACTGNTNLVFVEVQVGSYFGEDDIVRYEDDYARE